MGRTRIARVLAVVFVATVLFGVLASNAYADTNAECLACHTTPGNEWTAPAVDRTLACAKCHTAGLVGAHPQHNAGGNCGACHWGWGNSLRYAVPTVLSSGASFASAESRDASSSTLHLIHSQSRWISGMTTEDSVCRSCHAPAACAACHDLPAMKPRHTNHSMTGRPYFSSQATWTPAAMNPQSPYTSTVGHGVVGGDQTVDSATEETQMCSTAGCHDTAGVAASAPIDKEAYPSASNLVTLVGSGWDDFVGGAYQGNIAMYSNNAGDKISATVNGDVIEIITDKDPYRGQARVRIDGSTVATISCYAPTKKTQQVAYRSGTLVSGNHTVEVEVLGSTETSAAKADWIMVDSFRAYSGVRTSVAPDCGDTCHPDREVAHGTNWIHEATSTAFMTTGTYRGFQCQQCHTKALIDEHQRTSAKTSAGDACSACHTVYAAKLDPRSSAPVYDFGCTWNPSTGTRGCHQAAYTQAPHNAVDTTHTPTAAADEAKCRGCHAGNLDVIHTNSVTTNAFVTDCLDCHGPALSPSTKSCLGGCHVASGVSDMEAHPYVSTSHVASSTDASVSAATTGGLACATCHMDELYPEHDKAASVDGSSNAIICSTCHDKAYLPRPWNGKCSSCHATGKAPTAHNAFGTVHDYAAYSAANTAACGGGNCHNVALADVIHAASNPGLGNCTSCHTAPDSVPTEKLCTDCHSSHNVVTPHTSGGYPASTPCLKCHTAFTRIDTAHPSCATCHGNPALTDYLNDNYTGACTDCHATGAGKLGTSYMPYDPNHYTGTESTHTASAGQAASTYDYDAAGTAFPGYRCDSCHSMEMKPEHITKTTSSFVGIPATYADKCLACHQQKVNNFGGAWSDVCADCHTAQHTAATTKHNARTVALTAPWSGTALLNCGGGGCHNVDDVAITHNNSVPGNGMVETNGCAACHTAATVPTSTSCSQAACHTTPHDMNVHVAPNSAECVGCHENDNVMAVHNNNCDLCHQNPSYPGITTSVPDADCAGCHDGINVGTHGYSPIDPNHYSGTEATHTSSANGTYSGYQCTQCHQMPLKDEHGKASVAFPSFGSTTTVAGKCTGCHELKVDNFTLAWDKKCASCHPATHTDRSTKHNASSTNGGCGPSKALGCHDVNDVALIHNNSITTNAMYPSCITCHASPSAVPAPIDCDAAGCHQGMTHSHSLNVSGSNYNNTNVTGCTNSGVGCHGTQAASGDYAISQYHPDAAAGCQTGRCHRNASNTATNTTQPNAAFNNPNTCQNCHGGRSVVPLMYENAPDVVGLATATPGGHYNEATHTIVSVVQTMSVGGVAQTTCVTCHQHSNPSGIDGEWYQHQVLQGYGNTTCVDCHSFTTPGDLAGTSRVGSLIATSVANNRHLDCGDCHNALIMGASYDMHETTSSPPATATVMSTPGFQCGDSGCHADTGLEIHQLHKGDGKIIPYQRWNGSAYVTYTPTRCAQAACHPNYSVDGGNNLIGSALPTGTATPCERRPEPACVDCHNPLLQGWKPTAKTCGVNGACHITSPHSQMGPAHSATALSQACIDCHETTDLRTNHGYTPDETCGGAVTNVCHDLEGTTFVYNSVTTTFTLSGKKECADCHALGKMPNVTRDHAPHDPNHYTGSETTHTAISQTGTFGKIYSTVATENFNSASWPTSWTRSSTTTVTTTNGAPLWEGTYYARIQHAGAASTVNYFERTFDTASVSSPTVLFNYMSSFSGDDSATVSVSTNGTTYNTVWTTTATQSSWTTVGPVAVPRSATLYVRFSAKTNSSNNFKVDQFVLKPGDAVGAGCFLSCHYAEMKPEHFKVSAEATRVPGIYPDKCVDCHENKADAFDVTKNVIDWNRTCVQCHGDEKHFGQSPKHDASLVAPGCGGSGCHFIKDVAVIHNNSSFANTWPANPAQTCTVCHNSLSTTPQSLACGSVGCHEGVSAHAHDLDYDGSLFNPATVTGCVQSGAGCHGNLTGTNYAADYHAATGCLSGNCHNAGATNHNDPQFNDPNTCENCHGGGALLYAGATDRVPVSGASPNGHYPETTHTAVAGSKTASISAGGTITARCNQCHNDVNAAGVDGLYFQHTGVGGSIANVTCVNCHNYNLGITAEVTGDWTTNACSDCHNVTDLPTYVQHSSTAPTVTGTEAEGAGSCVQTGCHVTLNLHTLHKGSASTPATRAALGCAFTGCHDYTKQGKKPTAKSCGVGGACHTIDSHNPAAHAPLASTNCTACHEGSGGAAATDIRYVYASNGFGATLAHGGCSDCHNAGANLGSTNPPTCTSCHDGVKVGTHSYNPYDPNHYYATSHDSSSTSSGSWGTGTYGSTLSDYHGTTISYERGCTTCHTIDLKTEHDKTSVTFGLGGKADKCQACHELKVDNWTARWSGSCAGEANSCHDLGALHGTWSTKHDFSTATMTAPGKTLTLGSSATTFTQDFGTTAGSWPTTWTRSSTTSATTQVTSARSGAALQFSPNISGTTSVSVYATATTYAFESGTLQFWYTFNAAGGGDYLAVEVSTDRGKTYENLTTITANAATWSQSPLYSWAATATTRARIRFKARVDQAGEFARIDDVVARGQNGASMGATLTAGSTAAVSCGNPSGTGNPQSECHNVTDVADIHSDTPGNGCALCHVGTATNPVMTSCQTTGCHVGINNLEHTVSGVSSDFHETTFLSSSWTSAGVGSWCTGCHDNSIANEHFVLGKYGATPCSVCHKKSSTGPSPTVVTSADTSSSIHGNGTGNNQLCTDCHKTISWDTSVAVIHARRTKETTLTKTFQFRTDNFYSGHRIFPGNAGAKTSGFPGVPYTFALPAANGWLLGQQGVQRTPTTYLGCNDCHGSVTGATGPHGGAMTLRLDPAYPTDWKTSQSNGTSANGMNNTTNLCAKCHNLNSSFGNSWGSAGNAHGDNLDSHTGYSCISCHVKIPHAWKRPRLLGYTTDPAPYASTVLQGIQGANRGAWSSSSQCQAGCSNHSGTPSPKWP